MGFTLQDAYAPTARRYSPARNRVGRKFIAYQYLNDKKRPSLHYPCRENRPTPTKPASGRTFWTSADPAGYPDGPNQQFYAPVPTHGLDPFGLRKSQGKPGLPTDEPWKYSEVFHVGGPFEGSAGLQERTRFVYTDWVTVMNGGLPVGGVGSENTATTATGSVSHTKTEEWVFNLAGEYHKIKGGITYTATSNSSLTFSHSETKPATPGVEWEWELLIAKGKWVTDQRHLVYSENGNWQDEGDSWQPVNAGPSVFSGKLGVEWFE